MKMFCYFGKISIRILFNISSQFFSVYFPWSHLDNPTVTLAYFLVEIQPAI